MRADNFRDNPGNPGNPGTVGKSARDRARARAGPHPACVRANVHVGAALSIKSAPFYRMARFLGIPRKRSAFYADS